MINFRLNGSRFTNLSTAQHFLCLLIQITLLFEAKVTLSFLKRAIYQIKFCTFVLVRQKNANMNRIKEVLEAKGISQTELANRLGKTFNMVNLYATNKVQPPIPVLYQIADILDVDVRELLVSNK